MIERAIVEPPATVAASGEVVALRDGAGEMTEARRRELLEEVRAGKTVELELDAVTFLQPDGKPNRNYVRFRRGSLSRLAKSFKGMPFLRDHEQGDITKRGGTIVASKLEDRDGVPSFVQTLKLVKPWAVEAALDGTLDRFSIGWSRAAGSDILCTGCGESMFWLKKPKSGEYCMHFPGEVLEDGTVVEMEYQDAVGVECSAVSVPAVVGTEVESIRAALSAARAMASTTTPTKGSNMTDKLISKARALLSVGADADDAAVLAELERRLQADTLLAAEREAHTATKDRLAKAEAELAAAASKALAEATDGLIERAVREGRIANRVPGAEAGAIERAIRMVASTGIDAAREYVESLPKVFPIGKASRAEETERDVPKRAEGNPAELTEAEESARKQLGLSVETWKKHNPRTEA